jgi:thioredoxin 1
MSVLHIGNAEFDEKVIKSEKPVLVDFYASWCGPCKMLAPVLEEIAEEHPEYVIVKVNVDEEPELSRKYNIMSIPALFVIRDGEIADKAVGYRNKDALLEMLEG